MNRARTMAFLTVAAAASLVAALAAQTATVTEHVSVIDGPGAPTKLDFAVAIQGERIIAVKKQTEYTVPSGARVLDLTGGFVLPGFIDTHAHVTVLRTR